MNINLESKCQFIMGGKHHGSPLWSKDANDIDKCFKIYYLSKGDVEISDSNETHLLKSGKLYFINGYKIKSQKASGEFTVD